MGFSKSGWGALTLIFRSPEYFGYAFSWDAPLMMDTHQFGDWDNDRHFGTQERFAEYLPIRLIERHARHFRERPRIAILGHKLFGSLNSPDGHPQTVAFHTTLETLGVKQHFDNGLVMDHNWHAGWVTPAVDALMSLAVGTSDR